MNTAEHKRLGLCKEIIEVIENVTQKHIAVTDLLLSDYDSISLIKIIVAIEEKYGFEFSDDMLNYAALATIDNIIDVILEEQKESQ